MIAFREAVASDDEALTRLVSSPMPGNLSLAFCREPSYLRSCAQCGPPRRVLTAVDSDKLLALCSFFLREYHWEGQPRQIWTLSDFRAEHQGAGKSITGQGWTAIRKLLDGKPAMISVLDDNRRALKLFAKPRRHWPTLNPIARLCTNITPLWKWPRLRHRYAVQPLSREEILTFVNGRDDALAPLIESRDFGTVLPRENRFWGVFDNGRLQGCAGLSEPHAYRQVKIHSYAGVYRTLYGLGRAIGKPLLPEPHSVVPLSTASLLHCPKPGPFRALFDRLKAEAQAAGSKFLVWSRGGADHAAPWDKLRFRYSSQLYQLLWEGDAPLPKLCQGPASHDRNCNSPLGFEIAWL